MSHVHERPQGANDADPSVVPRVPIPLPARSALSGEGAR
jgi:hypothetical protein